jgi:hypothetical protein
VLAVYRSKLGPIRISALRRSSDPDESRARPAVFAGRPQSFAAESSAGCGERWPGSRGDGYVAPLAGFSGVSSLSAVEPWKVMVPSREDSTGARWMRATAGKLGHGEALREPIKNSIPARPNRATF